MKRIKGEGQKRERVYRISGSIRGNGIPKKNLSGLVGLKELDFTSGKRTRGGRSKAWFVNATLGERAFQDGATDDTGAKSLTP